jgi:hypothetical protein
MADERTQCREPRRRKRLLCWPYEKRVADRLPNFRAFSLEQRVWVFTPVRTRLSFWDFLVSLGNELPADALNRWVIDDFNCTCDPMKDISNPAAASHTVGRAPIGSLMRQRGLQDIWRNCHPAAKINGTRPGGTSWPADRQGPSASKATLNNMLRPGKLYRTRRDPSGPRNALHGDSNPLASGAVALKNIFWLSGECSLQVHPRSGTRV